MLNVSDSALQAIIIQEVFRFKVDFKRERWGLKQSKLLDDDIFYSDNFDIKFNLEIRITIHGVGVVLESARKCDKMAEESRVGKHLARRYITAQLVVDITLWLTGNILTFKVNEHEMSSYSGFLKV